MIAHGGRWKKSSYSGVESNCVEINATTERTAVRDTKDRSGGTLTFTPKHWARFLHALKDDRYL